MSLPLFLLHLLFILPIDAATTITTLPGCPASYGNLTIPFPFRTQTGCHLSGFLPSPLPALSSTPANFNSSPYPSRPPRPQSSSESPVTTAPLPPPPPTSPPSGSTSPPFPTPFPIPATNSPTSAAALSLSTTGLSDLFYTTGCIPFCNELSCSIINATCSSIGCGQTTISSGLQIELDYFERPDDYLRYSSYSCGLGWIFFLLAFFILYYIRKKRRMLHLKEQFFNQNGGLLLQQQLSAHEGLTKTARIFTAEELKCATDNYADSRILGHGGNGTVYKGVLADTGLVVAIKKSHLVEPTQIEQFINEVVLLSQVIHKNIVRIIGCCLETQVPLLVYEYIPNGTLHHHLHERPGSLSWAERLRVAGETAAALAYLHSDIARPIFHRDVKTANILMDHNNMAKMADFGASRLIPMDDTQITTLVIGTLGYLDPEYFQTGQLTEKSDVYSFGVVLAEMMTGQKPLSNERPQTEMNLAIYFLLKMRHGRLQGILEQRVNNEGNREQVEAIAELAKRCLSLRGEERPTMREVATDIERVRRPENTPAAADEEENRLLGLGGLEELSESTRFYSSRMTSLVLSETETETRYFSASATGDESLDQHILLSLEMQR